MVICGVFVSPKSYHPRLKKVTVDLVGYGNPPTLDSVIYGTFKTIQKRGLTLQYI